MRQIMMESMIAVLGAGLLGVFAWAFNQSNRLSVAEANAVSLMKLVAANTENFTKLVDIRFAETNRRLDRIESMMKEL